MAQPTVSVRRIARIVLVTSDVPKLCDFYTDALGFTVIWQTLNKAVLQLGAQEIELVQAPAGARLYPQPSAANDPWFQHFAIRVCDMGAAYERLARYSPRPISVGGPQRLPPSSGSVTAYKFRDPDGHPLELSFKPGGHPCERADRPFVSVDHTALAVSDLQASVRFYTQTLGFRVGPRFLNQGTEQDRLDGLADVQLDIVILETPQAGPHVELLHYRGSARKAHPVAARHGDISATRTVIEVDDHPVVAADPDVGSGLRSHEGVLMADPDGHLLEVRRPSSCSSPRGPCL
jgi:catechol 2,3-dioxygenase-like lactoylglutathione lyase family enzyme